MDPLSEWVVSKLIKNICLEMFWTIFAYKKCLICAYFSPDSDEITFSLEKAILWMGDFFSQKKWFVKP